MKAVILAGGFGTRISEESVIRPKPMVEIGGKPILWHIMKIYSHYGINDFVICCGYKGYVIKEYFMNYALSSSDVTIDLKNQTHQFINNNSEPWNITLVNTGEDSMTGGRIKKIAPYINNKTFCLTYGDGVSNVNIDRLIQFHREHKTLATVTAVRSPGRFGAFNLSEGDVKVTSFREKHPQDEPWINGGFFVLEPGIFDYIKSDSTVWEQEPMRELAHQNQLSAFKHDDFWQPMDTLRDKHMLEKMWAENKAPWKVWIAI